jgi:hypothetical protein
MPPNTSPAPWSTVQWQNDSWLNNSAVVDAEGKTIAGIVSKANAAIIKATPDLYEVCRMLSEFSHGTRSLEEIIEAANAAIEKANTLKNEKESNAR